MNNIANLRQLKHFSLVAQERSFHRAAELANLTQPALSSSIKALEAALGVQLLERTKHSVALTRIGETVLRRAHRILRESNNLLEEVSYIKNGEAGHLRIGLVPTFAYSFGASAIAQWAARSPRSSLDILHQSTQGMLPLLEQEQLDLIVCETRQVPLSGEIELCKIGTFPGGAFCRAGHPLGAVRKPSQDAVSRYPFGSVRMPDSMLDSLMASFPFRQSKEEFFSLQADDISVLREVTLSSDFIWFGNRLNVLKDLQEGLMIELDLELDFEICWGIASKVNRVLPPAAGALVEILTRLPRLAMAPLDG